VRDPSSSMGFGRAKSPTAGRKALAATN
jgi:hypothetical protein